MAHHRSTFARVAAAIAAENRISGRSPTGAPPSHQPGVKAPSEGRPSTHEPHRGSRAWPAAAPTAPPLLQQQARWAPKLSTFAGRTIPKWTRYGCYDEAGNLSMTRVL